MTQPPPYPDGPYGPGDEVTPPPLPGPHGPRSGPPPEIVPQQPLPRYVPGQGAGQPARAQQDQTVVGGFGDIVRTGVWTPARKTTAWQLFGDLKLDLREVLLPGETLEIESWSVFGDVKVIVPPGTQVLVSGGALLGDVKTETDPRQGPTEPTGARLVLNAFGLFGDVRVREAGPDVGKPPRGWRWANKRG